MMEPRFEGDLFTPKWIRGIGESRQFWCGYCKPGRWLRFKSNNLSRHNKDMHDILPTGHLRKPREVRLKDGQLDKWEWLCEYCNKWIPAIGWFRHERECNKCRNTKDNHKRKRQTVEMD